MECHQGDHPSGGLLLTSREGLLAGGDSGAAVDLKDPTHSFLLERVIAGDMPPAKQGRSQKLPKEEIEILSAWLDAGAQWPRNRTLDYFERTNDLRAGRDWWSLQPIERPAIPVLKNSPQPANPIDAFIQSKLEEEGFSPAPPADRRTLLRRLYFDLIGLPPTAQQIAEFENDNSPDAWIKKVDELLALPHYGERWGRYWLDLVRYADTSGYERDQEKPFAWKYRDWVVNAFNEDMPYPQFITEQLAGDELDEPTESSVIATGFLRLGTWNDEPNDKLDYQYERLEDLVHTTSSAFLGLTVKCARCHAHKFDAITQTDYYRMASAFWAGPLLTDSKSLGGPSPELLGFEKILGWTDTSAKPTPLFVLNNGERDQPLAQVQPASLSTIPALERPFEPAPAGAPTSHRRKQLAEWIAHPRHPLTSRVFVNRIWQHHFGRAIVRTPNNFGFLADPPTHPELLDWLASEFDSGGRRMKHLHRLILTSQTWQQSVVHPQAQRASEHDSSNRWWWRAERRRLDAESLRDSLLSVSGELDRRVGGPGFKPTLSAAALEGLSRKSSAWQASPPDMQRRRSLYLYLKRGLLPPMMTAFDLCDPTLSCGRRDVTIVPSQALTLLNNRFVHDRSTRLASSIASTTAKPAEQIRQAWLSVLQREPTAAEVTRGLQHTATQAAIFANDQSRAKPEDPQQGHDHTLSDALVLQLEASQAVVARDGSGRIETLPDRSGYGHSASQSITRAQPTLVEKGINGLPTLRFDGIHQYLHLTGSIVPAQSFTIVCVAQDEKREGHRELISNWNGSQGNSTSSLFLGLTDGNAIRFSDALTASYQRSDPTAPFVLTAVNGPQAAEVFFNGQLVRTAAPLPQRRLDTQWVIGQQGNIDGEYWQGGIAEIRAYNRDLADRELQEVTQALADRYGIPLASSSAEIEQSPALLALASLCHVLMNSNEFLFID